MINFCKKPNFIEEKDIIFFSFKMLLLTSFQFLLLKTLLEIDLNFTLSDSVHVSMVKKI